jgi:two-component sensor histidine kinase
VQSRTAELVAALREREVLFQEVHHRVKNNLQVISSLLNMQLRSLGEGASRDALMGCQTRVQAMALIHEKLYQSKDHARVPFSEYARNLARNVFAATGVSPQGVSLELVVEDVALAVDKAIPCGLILNELITNALKHAFPGERAGTIRVELRQVEGGGLRLAVSDDGVGLPAGLDIQAHPSLGLQLVRMLAQQLDAGLELVRTAGTSFLLTVPAKA